MSDRRRIVQHIDSGGRGLLPDTGKDMGSTNWIVGTPDKRRWTRVTFDGKRPTCGMLTAFSHIAKQSGRHASSARPTEVDPHSADPVIGDGSAEYAQKRFAIDRFGDVLFGVFSTEFSEVSLEFSGMMQIWEHTPVEPGHRVNLAWVARQQF